uniref:Uncharacterized protein n=1 Tax=Tetranychus urticae TaxID=32264 RepID=T1KPZ8_TETUR
MVKLKTTDKDTINIGLIFGSVTEAKRLNNNQKIVDMMSSSHSVAPSLPRSIPEVSTLVAPEKSFFAFSGSDAWLVEDLLIEIVTE